MNKLFLTLGFSLFTGLSAEKCSQEPCCPSPKPPVCCECYLPNYYDLQCDAGVYLYGDFLYWYAKEDNLSTCMTVQGNANALGVATSGITGQNTILNLVEVNQMETKWDPGFRVAIGYNFDHDGWDLEANYTWYRNRHRHIVSVPGFSLLNTSATIVESSFFPGNGQLALIDPWLNNTFLNTTAGGGGNLPFLFEKVSSLWKLDFEQIDLELGRKVWLGQYTAIRTYAGVRGALFSTKFFNVAYNLAPNDSYNWNNFSDRFKDTVWGVGILGGIQPEWHFARSFMLFSNLDAALLWGKFNIRKDEDYASFGTNGVQTINYHNTSRNIFFKMQAVLDVALGLRWEGTWCSKVRTALDLAWENHIWFDVNHKYKIGPAFVGGLPVGGSRPIGFNTYEEEESNLMMGGPVARFRIDF